MYLYISNTYLESIDFDKRNKNNETKMCTLYQ